MRLMYSCTGRTSKEGGKGTCISCRCVHTLTVLYVCQSARSTLTFGVFLGESETPSEKAFLRLGEVLSFCRARRLLADSGGFWNKLKIESQYGHSQGSVCSELRPYVLSKCRFKIQAGTCMRMN